MSEVKGITNILEVVEGLKVVGVAASKIMKDGKINFGDIDAAKELIQKHEVLTLAIKDIGEVVPEAKDLSADELMQIGAAVVEAVRQVKAV